LTRVGVVAALPAEGRWLGGPRRRARDGVALTSTSRLRVSGVGAGRAAHAARELLAQGAGALLSWGTAAGLDPELEPGALLLPGVVVTPEGRSYRADARWRAQVRARLPARLRVHEGPLAASPTVLGTVEAKRALRRRTGALGADMESAAVAQTAEAAGVPFLAVRAVVDAAAARVPASALAALGADGRLYPVRLAVALVAGPGELGHVLRLGRGLRRAAGTLKQVASLAAAPLLGPELESGAAGDAILGT